MVIKWALLSAACVAVAIAVLAVRPIRTPGPIARDFEAYWAAGATRNSGDDPYGRAIWQAERKVAGVDPRRDELLPFVGPPHTLWAWSLAARFAYERATYVWWIVLTASLVGLLCTVILGSGAAMSLTTFIGAALLAITFAPISSDLALGQIALPAFFAATLVVVFAESSWLLAALSACVALAQPNVCFGLLSQIGRNLTTLAIVGGATLTYLLGAFAAGWEWPISYVRSVAEHGNAERFAAIQFDPASIAFDLRLTPSTAYIIETSIAVLALAAALLIAAKVRESFPRFAAFSTLSPFVISFFHEHDFVVAFAAALWCALRTCGTIRVIALAGTMLVAVDWLGLAQRPSGVAQSALLAFAAFAAYVALGENTQIRGSVTVAIGTAALIAVASILALHHPVPVWPDALSAFHLPATATVAEIWHEEQRASGLLSPEPAWGVLRGFSLLGCALLAYAIYRHPSYCRTARRCWDESS